MKKTFLLLPALLCFNSAFADEGINRNPKNDTLYTELKKEVVVMSSIKETNSLKSLPAAVSVFTGRNLEALQVHSMKDLSNIVPNYFVADYGSKMTAPMYIRGIGARSGSQTVSMYVDNIPYFNTTSYDVELFDIQHLEVMRGTQGTLYGRNAMGGIINIFTLSPLSYKGVIARVGGGSYGAISTSASIYEPINDKMGVSVAAFYNQHDGYFTNKFNGEKVDNSKNIGARLKYAWNISPRFTANYSVSIDYVEQGAFPYANAQTGEVNYNSPGYYNRNLVTNGLSLKYKGNGYELNSTTGYQYLNDDMNMDTDYTTMSYFQINQKQQEHSLSQEIVARSTNASNYQWSLGVYGFYDHLNLTPPVTMMEHGVKHIMQTMLDKLHQQRPNQIPKYTFLDKEILLDGVYKRPTYSGAIFHQSTYNNLFVKGLSVTGGIRLDYEKTKLDYNASTSVNYNLSNIPSRPPFVNFDTKSDTAIVGKATKDYLAVLPKVVMKYEFDAKHYAYASVSRGYKAGGHNIQMFADLLQDALIGKLMKTTATANVADEITYKPEYSFNYEIGGQCEIIDQTLSTNFALYYIDVSDVQVTQFVKSGGGRKIMNAGEADSKGFELGLKYRPCNGFFFYANYGYADATLKKYVTPKGDFSGNQIPFAPQSTLSLGGNISYEFKNKAILDKITFNPNYNGAGRMYWNEENSKYQDFYGTLDLRLALEKNIFTLECWGKNVLDENYDAFLFESSSNFFSQKGKPARWGASLKIKL